MNVPNSDSTRDLVNEILSRSYYQLDPSIGNEGASARIMQAVWGFIYWCLTPLWWVIEWIQGLPSVISAIVTTFLVLLVLALLFHIIYTIYRAVRNVKQRSSAYALSSETEEDPAVLEQEASRLTEKGDPLSGIRLLYKACLIRIKLRDKQLLRRGMTNREHLSRLRTTPLFEPMRTFVMAIDNKFYGDETCSNADYLTCKDAHSQLVSVLNSRWQKGDTLRV